MDSTTWMSRCASRSDTSLYLTHLTKGESIEDGYENLWSILRDKELRGKENPAESYIMGNRSAVCFQDAPLDAIIENMIFEKRLRLSQGGKIRYLPFGIRIDKQYAMKQGARPVIYGPKDEIDDTLEPKNHWRYVSMDFRSEDDIIDWTHEREWRAISPFLFEYNMIEVVVLDSEYYRKFVDYCIKNDEELLTRIRGITCVGQHIL